MQQVGPPVTANQTIYSCIKTYTYVRKADAAIKQFVASQLPNFTNYEWPSNQNKLYSHENLLNVQPALQNLSQICAHIINTHCINLAIHPNLTSKEQHILLSSESRMISFYTQLYLRSINYRSSSQELIVIIPRRQMSNELICPFAINHV